MIKLDYIYYISKRLNLTGYIEKCLNFRWMTKNQYLNQS